jgi:hypothetical protein
MKNMKRGILTMAYGKKRYIRMAKALAKSIKLRGATIPLAIVTDSEDPELGHLYDVLIPLRRELGSGLKQKIYLNEYTCFAETLFIDADSLVIRDIDELWQYFSNVSFGVVGHQLREGKAFMGLMDVGRTMSLLNLTSVPAFNGGMYYFRNDSVANSVFRKSRELSAEYDRLGFEDFNGEISRKPFFSEEPVFAIALASSGIDAVVDADGLIMRTPYMMIGGITIDVLKGFARFNKAGQQVMPAIVHFAGSACAFEYRRERVKLALAHKLSLLGHDRISTVVNLAFSCLYPFHCGLTAVCNVGKNDAVRRFLKPILKPMRDNLLWRLESARAHRAFRAQVASTRKQSR